MTTQGRTPQRRTRQRSAAGRGLAAARRAPAALVNHVRRSPATHVYLFVLLVTTAVLDTVDARLATALLRQLSTNLREMSRDAFRVLLLSAFLLDGSHWFREVAMVSVVLGSLERRVGTMRAVAVAAVGHVGATLVTTVGIWANVSFGHGGGALVRTIDVGASYVLLAGAGALVMRIRKWPGLARALLVVWVVVPFAQGHSFTDAGHLAAACIGATFIEVIDPTGARKTRSPGAGFTQHGRTTTI